MWLANTVKHTKRIAKNIEIPNLTHALILALLKGFFFFVLFNAAVFVILLASPF